MIRHGNVSDGWATLRNQPGLASVDLDDPAIQTLGKSAAEIGGWGLRKVEAGRCCGPG
jgi:hypothetical protein